MSLACASERGRYGVLAMLRLGPAEFATEPSEIKQADVIAAKLP